jgi:hypothetical protein
VITHKTANSQSRSHDIKSCDYQILIAHQLRLKFGIT